MEYFRPKSSRHASKILTAMGSTPHAGPSGHPCAATGCLAARLQPPALSSAGLGARAPLYAHVRQVAKRAHASGWGKRIAWPLWQYFLSSYSNEWTQKVVDFSYSTSLAVLIKKQVGIDGILYVST
eukprot:20725-Pelagomonas_calceolata.AAC.3